MTTRGFLFHMGKSKINFDIFISESLTFFSALKLALLLLCTLMTIRVSNSDTKGAKKFSFFIKLHKKRISRMCEKNCLIISKKINALKIIRGSNHKIQKIMHITWERICYRALMHRSFYSPRRLEAVSISWWELFRTLNFISERLGKKSGLHNVVFSTSYSRYACCRKFTDL